MIITLVKKQSGIEFIKEMEETYMFGIMLIEHLDTALKVKVLVAQSCLTLCYGL